MVKKYVAAAAAFCLCAPALADPPPPPPSYQTERDDNVARQIAKATGLGATDEFPLIEYRLDPEDHHPYRLSVTAHYRERFVVVDFLDRDHGVSINRIDMQHGRSERVTTHFAGVMRERQNWNINQGLNGPVERQRRAISIVANNRLYDNAQRVWTVLPAHIRQHTPGR